MKKLITILPLLLLVVIGFSQTVPKIVQRSTPSSIPQDARLSAQFNMYIPRYADTTSANNPTNLAADSSGAIIYTYDISNFWVRVHSPKRWIRVGGRFGVEDVLATANRAFNLNSKALYLDSGRVIINASMLSTDTLFSVKEGPFNALTIRKGSDHGDNRTFIRNLSSANMATLLGYGTIFEGQIIQVQDDAQFVGFQSDFDFLSSYPALSFGTGFQGGEGMRLRNDTLSGNGSFPFPDSVGVNAFKPFNIYWTNHNGYESKKFFINAQGQVWGPNAPYSATLPDTLLGLKDGYYTKFLSSLISGGGGSSNDSTLQQVMANSSLITDPNAVIESDPSNTNGTFGIQMIGSTTFGLFETGYASNRWISSLSDASKYAGFYSTTTPITALGSTTRNYSVGIFNQIAPSKYQYIRVDSNEAQLVSDTNRFTASRTRIVGQLRVGYKGNTSVSSGDSYSAYFSRHQNLPDNVVGTIYIGPGSSTAPANYVDVAFGAINVGSAIGFFTENGAYQMSIDTNGGTAIGRGYAANFGHTFPPVNGLIVQGEVWLDSFVRVLDIGASVNTADSVIVKSAGGYIKTAVPLSSLGGSGTNNANVGSGYRWLKPSSQEIKTAFAGLDILIDSSSNTDGLTFHVDTATMFPQIRATIPSGGGGGGVTSVAAGYGLNFSTITSTGSVIADTTKLLDKTAANVITGILNFNSTPRPQNNDGAALGTSSLQWSDLFLAEGGVIDWDNGDATLTQVANMVTLAGADLTVPNITLSAVSSIGVDTTTYKVAVIDASGNVRKGFWAYAGSGSGVTTMGAFGSSPNSNGATISGSTLTLQPANISNPGGLLVGAQSFPSGTKTFTTGDGSGQAYFVDSRGGGETAAMLAGAAGSIFAYTSTGFFGISGPNSTAGFTGGNDMFYLIPASSSNSHFGNLVYTQTDIGAQVNILPSSASKVGLIVKLASTPTADAFRVINSSSVILAKISSAGSLDLGTAGSVTGSMTFSGVTSGTITIQPASAAGTYTLTLPTTDGNNGEFLRTNGSGVLDWAAASGSGTVTDFVFTDANGFDGTVSTSTSTPTLSLTTTVSNTQIMYSSSGAIVGDADFLFNGSQLAFGTSLATNIGFNFQPTVSGTSAYGFYGRPSITLGSGGTGSLFNFGGTIVEFSSGNHSLITNVEITASTVTGGSATVGSTANLYVGGAMSATVSGTNWALYVSSGPTFFGGPIRQITTTITSGSTITPNADATNIYTVTALATNPTFAAPSGTPVDGQSLLIRVKDNGTARSLTFNAIYREGSISLPTTTVINETMYLQFVYNLADTKWDFLGFADQFNSISYEYVLYALIFGAIATGIENRIKRRRRNKYRIAA